MSDAAVVSQQDVVAITSMANQDRKRVPTRYSMTDLLKYPLRQLFDWYNGTSEPEPFDPWLAARGYATEAAVIQIRNLSMKGHGLLVQWEVAENCWIVGHPDHVDPKTGVVREIKSKDDVRDDVTIQDARLQGLAYAGARGRGARLLRFDEHGHPVEVTGFPESEHVIVEVANMWTVEGTDPVPVETDAVEALLDNLETRAKLLHEVLMERKPVSALDEFDGLETPPLEPVEPYVVPVAEGEEGDLADETVEAYVEYKFWEKEYEALKERWKKTLTPQDNKRKAPSGGHLTLSRKNSKTLDEQAWVNLGGPALEAEAEKARQAWETEQEVLRTDSANYARLKELEDQLATVRGSAQIEEPQPGAFRVYPPKAKTEAKRKEKQAQEVNS